MNWCTHKKKSAKKNLIMQIIKVPNYQINKVFHISASNKVDVRCFLLQVNEK